VGIARWFAVVAQARICVVGESFTPVFKDEMTDGAGGMRRAGIGL
jgi:hypothetical protein